VNPDAGTEAKARTWGAGDYSQIASRLVPVSERLCDAVELRAGRTVLDVATGHGNTALAAARQGALVTAIDITEPLLEQGRARARAEHLDVDFRFGDMEAMPFGDDSFDFVLSTFGAMFAAEWPPTSTRR
jgi:ubiquinone/menaquinone biosynthesis C-methylase UbiE